MKQKCHQHLEIHHFDATTTAKQNTYNVFRYKQNYTQNMNQPSYLYNLVFKHSLLTIIQMNRTPRCKHGVYFSSSYSTHGFSKSWVQLFFFITGERLPYLIVCNSWCHWCKEIRTPAFVTFFFFLLYFLCWWCKRWLRLLAKCSGQQFTALPLTASSGTKQEMAVVVITWLQMECANETVPYSFFFFFYSEIRGERTVCCSNGWFLSLSCAPEMMWPLLWLISRLLIKKPHYITSRTCAYVPHDLM